MSHAFDAEQLAEDVESGADVTDILDSLGEADPFDTGEKRLMFATLQDGVLKLMRGIRRPRSVRPSEMRELRAWVSSDAMTVYSFVAICHVLDIDVGTIRKAIRRYEETLYANGQCRKISVNG